MEEQQETAGKRVPVSSEKLKALQAAMDKIEKSYGRGAIMKLGDDSVEEVAVIPTGSIALNAALGVGGYPRGRVIEIYGPESSGKTTLAIHAIAEAQKRVVLRLLSMPSMRSIVFMPKSWVSMWRICGFRSLTVESRRWRLQTS